MRAALHSISPKLTRMSAPAGVAILTLLGSAASAGAQLAHADSTYFAELRWRSIGPPRSGYVSAPAGVPGDPTTYYAGMPEGGVWKTTNAGNTWKPVFDDVHVASVGAVAVAASEPSTVYAGTGDRSVWSFTPGKGVYKSTDGGKTWTNVGLRASQYIAAVVVSPRDPNTVLVAAQGRGGRGGGPGTTSAGTDERGVYRTTDGGRTWARVLPADGPADATDLSYDFSDPQVVYASVATGGIGLFRSRDGGVTWEAAAGRGLPAAGRIAAFSVSSGTHGQRLYAIAGGGGRGAAAGRALYRSDDGGDAWTLGTQRLASAGGKIYADPQNPDVVYVMGTSIYRSSDGGKSVASWWGAPSGADPRFMWIDPTNAKRMLIGVDQGAAITVDGGASFTPYYGLVNGQFYRVATDYDFPYHVCGPQQDSGTACVASRSDFGEIRPNDWYPAGGFENGFLIADPSDKRYMYTQGWYHVLRRYDRVTGQVVVLYQPTDDERFGGAPPLAFSPQNPRTLYMAAQHVLMSPDGGEHWRTISPDLAAPRGVTLALGGATSASTGVGAPAAGGSITALALSPVTSGVIWVGTSTRLIHVTRDGGATWANVTPPDVPGSINVIDASHHNPGTAYAAVLSTDGKPHLYRTSDYGHAWTAIDNGLADDGTMRVVREDPVDPNLLYAGSVTSAYVSFDKGDHWQSLQLNLPTTVVSDMTVHGSDLAISTYGRGFWILDDVTPLRQLRTAMAATSSAFLFKPDTVVRARWDNTQDTPLPPEMVVGENPPEGAILDYYLPSPASGPVTLTISDASGRTIREFSSIAPPRDTVMPNVPEYWLANPTVLATTSGMHRINWDLRYPDPPTLNYGYYGTLLDYREYTLNWHATPGHTYRSTIVGIMVVPATYTARLTVGGRSTSQPITIVPDPRVRVPAAALAAQFRLQQRMVTGLTVSYEGFNYVTALHAALGSESHQAGQVPASMRSLDSALVRLATAGFGIVHRDLGRRYSDQFIADAMPTPSIVSGVNGPCRQLDATLDALRKLGTSIGELNGMVIRSGGQALPSWTAPAAPACGR